MTVSIGADPEFFRDIPTQGIVPCVGVIPGTKEKPAPLGDGYFCHEDNVLVEVGFPASSNAAVFAEHLVNVKERTVTHYLCENDYLVTRAAHKFSKQELNTKQAKTFGCAPDFNAYTGGVVRTPPDTLNTSLYRYAGGHIHLGGNFNCPPFVAALFADLFLSLLPRAIYYINAGSSLGYCPTNYTTERKRNRWYGQPGIYREKPYGVEYRTPSNWWAEDYDSAYSMGQCAIAVCTFLEDTLSTSLRSMLKQIPWKDVQDILTEAGNQDTEQKTLDLFARIQKIGVPL